MNISNFNVSVWCQSHSHQCLCGGQGHNQAAGSGELEQIVLDPQTPHISWHSPPGTLSCSSEQCEPEGLRELKLLEMRAGGMEMGRVGDGGMHRSCAAFRKSLHLVTCSLIHDKSLITKIFHSPGLGSCQPLHGLSISCL